MKEFDHPGIVRLMGPAPVASELIKEEEGKPQQEDFQPYIGPELTRSLNDIQREFEDDYCTARDIYRILATCKWMKHKTQEEFYKGEWKDGFQNGKGILYIPHKFAYFGDFDKTPHGEGKKIFYEARITYWGEFDHKQVHGKGRAKHDLGGFIFDGITDHGTPIFGTIDVFDPQTKAKKFTANLNGPNTDAVIDYTNGNRYEGHINPRNLIPEAKGTMTYADNSVYSGQWRNGAPHGQGVFKWPNGQEYQGSYERGVKNGEGKFTYQNGKYYQGSWKNGKQDGYGIIFSKDKKVLYSGQWKNGDMAPQ